MVFHARIVSNTHLFIHLCIITNIGISLCQWCERKIKRKCKNKVNLKLSSTNITSSFKQFSCSIFVLDLTGNSLSGSLDFFLMGTLISFPMKLTLFISSSKLPIVNICQSLSPFSSKRVTANKTLGSDKSHCSSFPVLYEDCLAPCGSLNSASCPYGKLKVSSLCWVLNSQRFTSGVHRPSYTLEFWGAF